MADARSARRTAEKVARRRWPAAWSGPPASRGWRRPARQEAADALAAPAEAGRQLVQAAEAAALRVRAQAEVATADAGYAGAWQGARDAGAAARHGLPPAGRYALRPPSAARPTRRRRPTPPPPRRPSPRVGDGRADAAWAARLVALLAPGRLAVLLTSSPP